MTSITINLLVEEQLVERAKARDPLKIVIAAGVGLLALCAALGAYASHAAGKARAEAALWQEKWDTLSGANATGTGDTKSLKMLADDFVVVNQSRRLYAQQLALLKDIVPDAILISRISYSLSLEASAPAPVEVIGDDAGKGTAPAPRPKTTEAFGLSISGRSIGGRPEIEVDQFIQALRSHEVFGNQIKDVKLRSIARDAAPAGQDAPSVASVSFVIECQYKERK